MHGETADNSHRHNQPLIFVRVGVLRCRLRKLLIAHGAISNNVEPLWIAKEQGIFRKYGIEAELVFIIARAMQAMLAGQVPVGLVGATHVVNANTGVAISS